MMSENSGVRLHRFHCNSIFNEETNHICGEMVSVLASMELVFVVTPLSEQHFETEQRLVGLESDNVSEWTTCLSVDNMSICGQHVYLWTVV